MIDGSLQVLDLRIPSTSSYLPDSNTAAHHRHSQMVPIYTPISFSFNPMMYLTPKNAIISGGDRGNKRVLVKTNKQYAPEISLSQTVHCER
jgi:hypothetical protein